MTVLSEAHVERIATPPRPNEREGEGQVAVIWLLLFFSGMPFLGGSILPIPRPAAQLLTMGALGLALLLALNLNRQLLVRPNFVLVLATLLAGTALMAGVRGGSGLGALLRSARLFAFLSTLWLLTPWWGRRDLLLARCHLRALVLVLLSVVAGFAVAPGAALGAGGGGRLGGILWPIPAPQVAAYAAMASGMCLALWFARRMAARAALAMTAAGVVLILASHTRTALVGLVLGVACAAASLFLSHRRVRRIVLTGGLLVPLAALLAAPAALRWFNRGQSAEEIGNLTGRTKVWEPLLAAPRPTFNHWFGFGLSDKSFEGLAIDSTWLATYQDQGLVGVGIVATTLLFLLVLAAFRPPGPERALATFMVVYCAVASYTEVTIGDSSPYVLAVVAAASMIVPAPGPDRGGRRG